MDLWFLLGLLAYHQDNSFPKFSLGDRKAALSLWGECRHQTFRCEGSPEPWLALCDMLEEYGIYTVARAEVNLHFSPSLSGSR